MKTGEARGKIICAPDFYPFPTVPKHKSPPGLSKTVAAISFPQLPSQLISDESVTISILSIHYSESRSRQFHYPQSLMGG